MEKPESIRAKIKILEDLLAESEEFHRYQYVCDSNNDGETIGFFKIGNAKKILTLLNDGSRLKYKHGVWGDVIVQMNPQRNRIFVTENEHINENNIMTYIVWATGTWLKDLSK
jgi:hypothetical protein